MARAEWGYNGKVKWCSYKRITVVVCSINIAVALYVLRSLYTSLYIYSYNESQNVVKYTSEQLWKMEESIRVRKASEPLELIKLVKEIKGDFVNEDNLIELPRDLRLKITDEILERLHGLNNRSDANQREAVENWRKEKIKETRELALGNGVNSTVQPEEAEMLARTLEYNWGQLSENIGLWIPAEVINEGHDDKPEGAKDDDEETLPGRALPPECNAELHTDYDGVAVRWGLTHHKESAFDCCQACLDQAKRANSGEKKCNIWVYCPLESGCYSPDIYEHKHMECWLKYAETPKLNFKDKYSETYRNSHPNAPLSVPWASGFIST